MKTFEQYCAEAGITKISDKLFAKHVWKAAIEAACEAIQETDSESVANNSYMLDSNDCIAVIRGEWNK